MCLLGACKWASRRLTLRALSAATMWSARRPGRGRHRVMAAWNSGDPATAQHQFLRVCVVLQARQRPGVAT